MADVPGRREPGTGEINYPAIARALAEMGYDGTIGLEAFASSDSELARAVPRRLQRLATPTIWKRKVLGLLSGDEIAAVEQPCRPPRRRLADVVVTLATG